SEYVIDWEVMAVILHFTSVPLLSRTTSCASAAAASPSANTAASAVLVPSFMACLRLLEALHRLVDHGLPVGAVEALLRLFELRPRIPAGAGFGHHLLRGGLSLLIDRPDLLLDAGTEQRVLRGLAEPLPLADPLREPPVAEEGLLDPPLGHVVVLLPVALALRRHPAAQVLLDAAE